MMNKKGAFLLAAPLVWAGIATLIFIPFFLGGGISGSWKTGKFFNEMINIITSIPKPVLFFFGLLFLIMMLKGKRRR